MRLFALVTLEDHCVPAGTATAASACADGDAAREILKSVEVIVRRGDAGGVAVTEEGKDKTGMLWGGIK